MKKSFNNSGIIPKNEQDRLAAVAQYNIIDTHTDVAFDNIASIAADIFNASGAFVNFVDADKVFFKANLSNFPLNKVDRKDSLCSLTILDDEITVIYDTHEFDDLRENQYISCNGGIRFYAGAPIKSPEGNNIGTVCVIDSVPRDEITDIQRSVLQKLAVVALDKLESIKAKQKLAKITDDRLHHVAHDLLNPLTSIILLTQQIQRKTLPNDHINRYAATIFEKSKSIEYNISNLLKDAQSGQNNIHLSITVLKANQIINDVCVNFGNIIKNKHQILKVRSCPDISFRGDRLRIIDILANYLSNASKYSPSGSQITIGCDADEDSVIFFVSDNGLGICETEIDLLFKKFSRISSQPTANERSHGFGLYSVKVLAELHHGTVWAESAGKGLGSTFFFKLPKN